MRSDTQTIEIAAPAGGTLAFLADPQMLPRWAIGFAKAVARDGDRWVVETGSGAEMGIDIRADDAAGTVDFHMSPAPGREVVAYGRVVPNGTGCEFVFTQFQAAGMPDDMFDAQVAALGHELVALRALLEVQCPT